MGESAAFVDSRHLADNVIVEAIETDEKCAHARRESEDTSFRETVGFEKTVFECANGVLLVLTGAVERSEIKVRGSLIDVGILLGCFEEISLVMSLRGYYHG